MFLENILIGALVPRTSKDVVGLREKFYNPSVALRQLFLAKTANPLPRWGISLSKGIPYTGEPMFIFFLHCVKGDTVCTLPTASLV